MPFPIRLFMGVSLIALSFSCTNLDPELDWVSTPETYFNSDQDFYVNMAPAYSYMNYLMRHNYIFTLQEVSSDEMVLPQRADGWSTDLWTRMHRHEFGASDEYVYFLWSICYGGILLCNEFIARFQELPQEKAAPYVAELRALRALYYYWLLDLYGNVPLYTLREEKGTDKANVPRDEVFAFVEKELLESLPLLAKEAGPLYHGRMNHYAVQALLSALYLNAEVYTGTPRWSAAIAACDEVINSGLYLLEGDYFANFKADNAGSRENILVVVYDQDRSPGFNLAQMTLHYESQKTYLLEQQPWNGYCTLQEFYQSFSDADVRKGSFLEGPQYAFDGSRLIDDQAEPGDPDGPPLTYTPEINSIGPDCYRQAGVRIGKFEIEIGAKPDLNNDAPVFRFAEILLNKAEALWRLNPGDGQALALVNQVRQRAGVPGFSQLSADSLLAERGRELAFEAKRRTDLIRFGRFTAAWEFKPPSEPCKTLFPLPVSQNSLLEQNPCY